MPNRVMTETIDRLASKQDISSDRASEALREIMDGNASEVQIAAFLIALRTKGETVDELVGLARTMRDFSVPVTPQGKSLLDTAGTGGGRSSFNISTAAALVAAGAGCKVAKHGNRSVTSRSGSADVLEALGVNIEMQADQVAECINTIGFGFMFAPLYHQATRFVVPARRELGVHTIFNLLGPLTNPAGATRQLVGVADPSKLPLMVTALQHLGSERAMVVSSADGMDELSLSAPTEVEEAEAEFEDHYFITPEDVGLKTVEGHEYLQGGDASDNATTILSVLAGEQGPRAEVVLLNAGAAIYVAGEAATIKDGVELAREAISNGRAGETLERYVQASQDV